MPATHPKPVNQARALIKTLYNQRRGPTKAEFDALDAALDSTDGRTKLDPSKRKHAAKHATKARR